MNQFSMKTRDNFSFVALIAAAYVVSRCFTKCVGLRRVKYVVPFVLAQQSFDKLYHDKAWSMLQAENVAPIYS